jgi:predicted ester cyclase
MRDLPAHPHAVLYKRWLRALERGVGGAALASFFTEEMVNIEHPNLLFPRGRRSELADVLRASERAQHVIERQRYEVLDLMVSGDRVAARLSWSGVLKVRFGAFAAGDTLRAEIAQFVTILDGRIAANETYDCYASPDA